MRLLYDKYPSEEIIRKAVAGEQEALWCVYEKYKGYIHHIVGETDKVLMEELEQQVWKGLIEDIKKFKI